MEVSKKEIVYLARLARLNVSDEESEIVSNNLSSILNYMAKLSELKDYKELALGDINEIENVFRPDLSLNRVNTEEALSRSPDPDKGFFRVPKVIK